MTEPWQYRPTQDRLLVFVSSRLQECAEERKTVARAIASIAQQPVLFEHLGARPYPPRDLYLSRLRDSQIMIGLYRAGYGYVDTANGMKVSGLEDEFRFAQRFSIPALFYISRSDAGRDERLAAMLNEMQRGGNTVWFYDNPEQLYDRVREDLAALITDRFLGATSQQGVLHETAADVLARVLLRTGVIVRRTALLRDLNVSSDVVCVHGPAGIGKTILVAQYADASGAAFVRATGLSPKEMFEACAWAIAGGNVERAPNATLEGARAAFTDAWHRVASALLVVDECDYTQELLDAIARAGGLKANRRLVFTSREPAHAHTNVEVRPWAPVEVDELLRAAPSSASIPQRVREEGNPLRLQEAIAGSEHGSGGADLGRLQGAAGEVVRYLALADGPLSAEQILALRADPTYTIDALLEDVKRVGRLVEDSPRGFRLVHVQVAAEVVRQVRESAQRIQFFGHRLLRLFDASSEPRRAYAVASLLGDGSAARYASAAAREAIRLGDWKVGVRVVDELLARALSEEGKIEAFHLMVSLVYPLELMGNAERAEELLGKARTHAAALGASAQAIVDETELSSRARRRLRAEDVEALSAIYRRYSDDNRRWDRARLGLELSALYIAARRYEDARDILRPTLADFEQLGDEYGVDLAQRNLASALSEIPGADVEAERLVGIIEERTRAEPDARRQRAWLCNILTRRLRKSGRYEDAERTATEAIAIGSELGDESVRAVNYLNLGNVYRDMREPARAIEAYATAARVAQACGRGDVEADSSRLTAGILNDFSKIQGFAAKDQPLLAKTYAQHAVGLLRGGVSYEPLGAALVELSEAQESLGDGKAAAEALFEAARAFEDDADEARFAWALRKAVHLALPDHVELYIARLSEVLRTERLPADAPLADQFMMLAKSLVGRAPRRALMPVLSMHLGELRSHMPDGARGAIVSALTEAVERTAFGVARESWRPLYAGVVFSSLLRDRPQPFFAYRLARALARGATGLFVREEPEGSRLWTLVLDLGRPVTISISSLDSSPETSVAAFALAMFMKGFEDELRRELLADEELADELQIHVAHVDHVPNDLRVMLDQQLGVGAKLAKEACIVTRPSDFQVPTPTTVFVGPRFLVELELGTGRGGSLQELFGYALVEVVFQLLRGAVEVESLYPKVVSLVRKTL